MKVTVPQISKKEQIHSLYTLGITGIHELALLTQAQPSYVASILREAHLIGGYFDLYTSTEQPMNIYSKLFARRLGFKDRSTARASVSYLNTLYEQFERIGDRAGQHHTQLMALTMRNRAVWSGKLAEAEIFGRWLRNHLTTPELSAGERMDNLLKRQETKQNIQKVRA